VRRADAVVAQLVAAIQRSPVWTGPSNFAVVITRDEGGSAPPGTPQGCCGFEKDSAANFGGGHIPTIVITNHRPRGRVDDTPYNHYSLLRTSEEALGIGEFPGHANDRALGVKAIIPMFAVA
jgi:arylsulfatase A-like enzyme